MLNSLNNALDSFQFQKKRILINTVYYLLSSHILVLTIIKMGSKEILVIFAICKLLLDVFSEAEVHFIITNYPLQTDGF